MSPLALISCVALIAVTMTLDTAAAEPLARPPGVVLSHLPASSGKYVGSPALLRLADGTLLAAHDEFGPQSGYHTQSITRLFRSTDRGDTWTEIAVLEGALWSSLFAHRDAIYLLGTDREYGRLLVRRSTDGGRTWTTPRDRKTGLLDAGRWHTAPVPIVEHAGRLWRAVEDVHGDGGWAAHFRARMMSIPVEADLLDADAWTISEPLARDPAWRGGRFNGWLEGNAVVTPDGQLVNVLRVETPPAFGVAAIVRVSPDGKTLSFDPANDFIRFPGGEKKFTIRRDPVSGLYWTLSNPVLPRHANNGRAGATRNAVALMSSSDLREWDVRTIVLHHPDWASHGFQYLDWLFDGEDLIALSRTAYDDGLGGAPAAHDANFLTFHRIADFRSLEPADSVVSLPLTVRHERDGLAVTGEGFSIARLADDTPAFSNRDYVWKGVPEAFRGWSYTRAGGGANPRIRVTAEQATTLHVATASAQPGPDLAGFTAVPDAQFHYTDNARSPLQVHRRSLRAGEQLEIPQGNWTGTLVLVPPGGTTTTQRDTLRVSRTPTLEQFGGVVIAHAPALDGRYIGSPGIAVLPSGEYLAKCDYFGPASRESEAALTRVFVSRDQGRTWSPRADVRDLFWANLFVHRGDAYLFGVSRNPGHVVVRKSTDGGLTWTEANDERTGLIARGAFHTAPMPMLEHQGRLWRAVERVEPGKPWGENFRSLMLSAPADADLLDARNWTLSNDLPFDRTLLGGKFGGWLEGNAVATPDGRVVNVLRVDYRAGPEKAAIIDVSPDGKTVTHDRERGFIDFPGGCKKFSIRFDPQTNRYWTLSNLVPPKHQGGNPERTRNTVALMSSPDVRNWTVHSIVLHHPDVAYHGFQYLDFVFDGDDLLVASRTAFDDGLGGADSQHNANFLTFHRVTNFRTRTLADHPPGGSPQTLGLATDAAAFVAPEAARPHADRPITFDPRPTVFPPGVTLAHSPASTGTFIGASSIVVLPNGEYLARFHYGGQRVLSELGALTRVFASADRGLTWVHRGDVEGVFWASLFVLGNDVYLFGTSMDSTHSHVVICRSSDAGRTWTTPADGRTGLLMPGNYHTAPVPVLVHAGRLWRTMERIEPGLPWGQCYSAFMLSAPVDADLLDARSWTASNALPYDPTLLGGRFGGWLEGNAVALPDGSVVNVLRVDYREGAEKAAIIRVSPDGRTSTFDPSSGFIDFPGGCKKFAIRFDPQTSLYWTLSNYVPPKHQGGNPERTRNTVVLMSSPDVLNWTIRSVVLYHPNVSHHAYQYLDFVIDGDDLLAVSRTAHDDGLGGAHNQHDANFMTFHRIESFRTRTLADAPPGITAEQLGITPELAASRK
jgi:photosystem II stability/assembly factor-like uncharacterized protein